MKIDKLTFKTWLGLGLVLLDQIANWLSWGNIDTTISARTYVFARQINAHFFRFLERVINYAFEPKDGPEHCKQAFESDNLETYFKPNWLTYLLFGLFVIPFCLLIIRPVIWVIWRNKHV